MTTTKTASLKVLAKRINAAHEAGENGSRSSLESFRSAGDYLNEAKQHCEGHTWYQWLEENVKAPRRTCSAYMMLASNWDIVSAVSATVAGIGLSDSLKIIRTARKAAKGEGREKPKPFDIVAYMLELTEWMRRKRDSLPEEVRGRFFYIMRTQLDGLEAEINASGRQGAGEAGGGDGDNLQEDAGVTEGGSDAA